MRAVEQRRLHAGLGKQHLEGSAYARSGATALGRGRPGRGDRHVKHQRPLPSRRELGLQRGGVGPAVLDDANLVVNDHALDRQAIETFGDGVEALRPVVAVAGVDRDPALVEVRLDLVAVVLLISWTHLSPRGGFDFKVASWGGMNLGKGRRR